MLVLVNSCNLTTLIQSQGCHTVLIYKICPFFEVHVLENFAVLTFKKCTYFEPYFVLFSALMSEITLQQ